MAGEEEGQKNTKIGVAGFKEKIIARQQQRFSFSFAKRYLFGGKRKCLVVASKKYIKRPLGATFVCWETRVKVYFELP